MKTIAGQQIAFLVVVALGLVPVALSYGLMPQLILPKVFDIDASDINSRHIFRGIMGLYLGLVLFWLAGAIRANLRVPALWSLIVFMAGLAAGRLLSLIVDGWPHPVLAAYLLLEAILAGVGVYLLKSGSVVPD